MAVTKVSVNLPDEVVEVVRNLATRRNTTRTEVFRRAISNHKFIQDELDKGSKILIEDSSGNVKEVVYAP